MNALLRTLFVATVSLCATAVLSVAAPTKPNVIIVLTDDQGYGDLSCHGNPVLRTPNLDKLHDESIRLTDFHVTPMCTPSRGQLMSGLDALRNGAMNVSSGRTFLRESIPTVADIFAASGYRTGQFGKWHLGDNYPYRPQDRGFQESIWFPSSHIPSVPDHWNNDYFDDTYCHNGKPQAYKGYCTDVFFGEAMKWMKDCSKQRQPFFTYLALNAAHAPLFVPQKYRDFYRGQKPNVASFFGMIANIDDNMGRLDAFLRETGLRDNTLLIFMTDNGGTAGVPVFNAGMKGGKVTLWEGGHRVPCFVRWPNGKLRAPADLVDLTEVQDVMPTLVELCGLKRPKGAKWDGTSLAKLLRGQQEHLPDRMLVVQFSRMNHPQPEMGDAAVLWRRWRLVQDKELYDLNTDFGQKKNVINEHPDVVARMRAYYEQWWAGIAPRVNEFSLIRLGSDREDPALLSPCDWQDVFLDQAAQVRRGEHKNGIWNVLIERAGDYAFELRRWPKEADATISAGVPEYQAVDGVYSAGVALPITRARLKVASFDQSMTVGGADKAITFSTKLKPGRTQVQTWFYDAEGKEICGAYYVYVRRK